MTWWIAELNVHSWTVRSKLRPKIVAPFLNLFRRLLDFLWNLFWRLHLRFRVWRSLNVLRLRLFLLDFCLWLHCCKEFFFLFFSYLSILIDFSMLSDRLRSNIIVVSFSFFIKLLLNMHVVHFFLNALAFCKFKFLLYLIRTSL